MNGKKPACILQQDVDVTDGPFAALMENPGVCITEALLLLAKTV
jgi:hypothetical protein